MFFEYREVLKSQAEESIRKLSVKLCPDEDINWVLGVRIPNIRKIAKQVLKNDWEKYLLEVPEEEVYLEEKILEGLVIAGCKVGFPEKLRLIEKFIPKINNWMINDTFVPSIKPKSQDMEILWKFINPYLKESGQFSVRFAVITMLDYFIVDDYIDRVIFELDKVSNDGYYAKMAVAWCLAECGVKYNGKTIEYLKGENNLDKFTFNKTLQKMRESYRILDSQKEELKLMKRV